MHLPLTSRIGALVTVIVAALAPVGCSDAPGTEGTETSADAFTVESGDRFVVSATPEKVVVLKRAGSAKFPFEGDGLKDKVLVVHPVAKKADTGVVARAVAVEDAGDRWVVETKPLTLDEIAAVGEDEIVRVFVAARKLKGATQVGTRSASDLLVPGRVQPAGLSGFVFDGFDIASALQLKKGTHVRAGVTFSHKIEKCRFSPEGLVDYSRDEGLELGFRGSLEWQSKLTVGGSVSGELFRSETASTPPVYLTVPVGFIPVPVVLNGEATIVCNATVAGPIEVEVGLSATAKLGGSVKINPSTSTSPSDWVSQGRWAPEADGSVDVSLGAAPKLDATVACSLPRIDLKATVAGVAGPYFALIPTMKVGADGATFEGKVNAGVGAGMFGLGTGVEVNLYTWTP